MNFLSLQSAHGHSPHTLYYILMIKGTKYNLDNASEILVASRAESEYMFQESIQVYSINFC